MRRRLRLGLRPLLASTLAGALVFAASEPPQQGAGAAEPAAYVAGIDDLPLMPGLVTVPDAGVIFDKPSGRIVESYAEGALARAAVAAFYAATLPQLGWRARQSNVFVREGERLSLIFLGGDGELIVRFTLEPQ